MGVLLYLLVPVAIVGLVATAMWVRNRQPTSLEAGVESFRREMEALSPDAGLHRRREQDGEGEAQPRPAAPSSGPRVEPRKRPGRH